MRVGGDSAHSPPLVSIASTPAAGTVRYAATTKPLCPDRTTCPRHLDFPSVQRHPPLSINHQENHTVIKKTAKKLVNKKTITIGAIAGAAVVAKRKLG